MSLGVVVDDAVVLDVVSSPRRDIVCGIGKEVDQQTACAACHQVSSGQMETVGCINVISQGIIMQNLNDRN